MTNKRRSKGDGSIYKRASDGRWVCSLDLGWHLGKRNRPTEYFDTEREAKARLREMIRARDRNATVRPAHTTLKDFIAIWLEQVVKPNRATNTYSYYEALTRLYILPKLGRTPLGKLSATDIREWQAALLDEGVTGKNVKLANYALRTILRQAIKEELIETNAALLVDPPRTERFEARPLEEDEVVTFLKAIQGKRHELVFLTAIGTGLRIGELLGLRWEDIDTERRFIHVRGALHRVVGGQLQYKSTKNVTSKATIAIPRFVADALHAHKKSYLEAEDKPASNFVFATNRTGAPPYPTTILRALREITEATKLPPIRFHDLRHTYGSMLLDMDVDLKAVSDMLRHRDIATTANTYGHTYRSKKQASAAKLDERFGS